ncbi:MAG: hypothetical protein DRZ82_00820 [Thermoprotei archaeon]|nr:MAG: hypothetical protein DRZ82_00820 [Thermoprotei archaeon]
MKTEPVYIFLSVLILLSGLYVPLFTSSASINDHSSNSYIGRVVVYAPAVTRTTAGYEGVMTKIEIIVSKPGYGDVYISTNTFIEIDMQASARTAAFVACTLTGKNFYDYNFYVKVLSDVPIVGGPSAGALITIGMVAALLNASLNPNATMTGMINPDGTIGPVGGIFEKARAAYKAGFKVFLIPYGQDMVPYVERGRLRYLNITEYAARKWKLKVIEVSDIYDALRYMLGITIKRHVYKWKTPELVLDVVKLMLTDLHNNASNVISEASQALKEITNPYVRMEVKKALDSAISKIREAEEISSRWPYVSASLCFQAAYLAQYVVYVREFVKYGNKFFMNTLKAINSTLNEISIKIKNYEKENLSLSSIEILLGAKIRIRYGRDALETALSYYKAGEVLSALMWLAHAKWRTRTAIDWLNSLEMLPSEEASLNGTQVLMTIRNLAKEYIYEAKTVVIYVNELVKETGAIGSISQEAEEASFMLSYAEQDYDLEDYMLALAEAIESIIHATLAINLLSSEDTLRRYANLARDTAYENIGLLMSKNVIPMLSICYYEFAEYYFKEKADLITALFNYKMASAQSKVLLLIGNLYNETYSSIVQEASQLTSSKQEGGPQNIATSYVPYFLWFILGLIVGSFIVGLLAWRRQS